MNEIQKIFSNYLFRVMATWFGFYIQDKVAASILEPVQQAQQIADQTIAQAQGIADSFTIRRIGSQDNVEASVNYFAANPSATDGYIWVDSTCPWKEWDETAQKYKAKVYVNVLYIGGEEVTV